MLKLNVIWRGYFTVLEILHCSYIVLGHAILMNLINIFKMDVVSSSLTWKKKKLKVGHFRFEYKCSTFYKYYWWRKRENLQQSGRVCALNHYPCRILGRHAFITGAGTSSPYPPTELRRKQIFTNSLKFVFNIYDVITQWSLPTEKILSVPALAAKKNKQKYGHIPSVSRVML